MRALNARGPIAAGLIAFATIAIPTLLAPGVPAFRHDWQWPTSAATFAGAFFAHVQPWSWTALGQPNATVQLHPYYMLSAALAGALGAKALLVLWVAGAAGAFAAGSAAFARKRYGASDVASCCCGVLAGLAPFVVNKFVAGHVPYMVALAAVPWALLAATGRSRRAAVALVLALAWTTLQFQIVALTILAVLILRELPWRAVLAAIAATAIVEFPLLFSLFDSDASAYTQAAHTSTFWEFVQSSPWTAAIRGVGYFTHYWETATASLAGWRTGLSWTYPLALAAAALALPFKTWWRLALVFAMGFVLVSGLDGPGAPGLTYLFDRVGAFSAFRELYHAAFLIALVGALCAGAVIAKLPRGVQWAALAGATILCVLPWLDGGVFGQLGNIPTDSTIERGVAQAAARAPESRVEYLPLSNPTGPSDASYGGLEPLAYPFGSLHPFWIYVPRDIETWLPWALQSRDRDAVRGLLGISTVATRAGFSLHSSVPFSLGGALPGPDHSHAFATPAGVDAVETVAPRASVLQLRSGSPAGELRPARDRTSFEQDHGTDPNNGAAPIVDLWFVDPVLARGSHGVVTTSARARIAVSCARPDGASRLAVLGNGTVDGHPVDARSWEPFPFPCSSDVDLAARPGRYVAVTPFADIAAVRSFFALMEQPIVDAAVDRAGTGFVLTAARDCAPCTIVLATRYSSHWQLYQGSAAGAPAAPAGGLEVWRVALHAGERVRIAYDLAPFIYASELLGTLGWLLGWALAWSAFGRPRHPRSSPDARDALAPVEFQRGR